MVPSRGNARSGRDEFRETFERLSAHGNPEPSRRYTGGRCRDYLGARVPLMTGMSIPHPHAWAVGFGTGEEIVHSWRKRRGSVNPLVVGSNPTGPRTYRSAGFRRDPAKSTNSNDGSDRPSVGAVASSES